MSRTKILNFNWKEGRVEGLEVTFETYGIYTPPSLHDPGEMRELDVELIMYKGRIVPYKNIKGAPGRESENDFAYEIMEQCWSWIYI